MNEMTDLCNLMVYDGNLIFQQLAMIGFILKRRESKALIFSCFFHSLTKIQLCKLVSV